MIKPGSLVRYCWSPGGGVWLEERGMVLVLLNGADEPYDGPEWSRVQVLFGEKIQVLWRNEVEEINKE